MVGSLQACAQLQQRPACSQPCARRSVVQSPRRAWSVQQRSLRLRAQQTSTEPAGPVTQDDFEEKVLKCERPVLVDYWAPWCGPCRMIAPIVDELAVEYKGKLDANNKSRRLQYKLNTDESPSIATEYGIRSIPTVMLFKGGKKVDVIIGAVPKSTLKDCIERFID